MLRAFERAALIVRVAALGALAVWLVQPAAGWGGEKSEGNCAALSSFRIEGGRIVSARHVRPPFKAPSSMSAEAISKVREKLSPIMAAQMEHGTVRVPFCKVVGVLTPTTSSEINFEAWLPEDRFNGRLVQEGDGGLLGAIPYTLMSKLINQGYAVMGSDKGHNNARDPMDWRWAVNQPEKVIDHHFRATHVTTIATKAIVARFYGGSAHRTYFSGCSGGAVQGYEAAMHNPDDFDGMAIGGAGPPLSNLRLPSGIFELPAILARSNGLGSEKLEMVSRAAVAACDSGDGVKDGVISYPKQCGFDPGTLICQKAGESACLSDLEAQAIKEGYALGMLPGTEYYWRFAEKLGAIFPAEAYKYLSNPPPPEESFLQTFAAKGHKMIVYIGAIDVSAPAFEKYQEALVANVQRHGSSLEQAEEDVGRFYRAFELPGMEHCAGGPGPNNISASLQPERSITDPHQDIMAALVNWVENGTAPDYLVATKYRDDSPLEAAITKRPICVYPKLARWDKKGDSSSDRSFSCVSPPAD